MFPIIYYHIHFIAEPSSNGQVNKDSEGKLRHAHQEDDGSNDSIPDNAYDRDGNNDDNDDADEESIGQQHGDDNDDVDDDLNDDDYYLDEDSEGDEDEADFDNEDDDFHVSEEETGNLSDENDPQNNPKACKKKSHVLLLLHNLLDTTTMKTT